MHRSRQNIHHPTNSCDRFCYEIARNAGTLESEFLHSFGSRRTSLHVSVFP